MYGKPYMISSMAISATGARANLFRLIEQAAETHEPIQIVGRRASAVLAASIFHFGTYSIAEAKAHMASAGIAVRAPA